MEGTEARYWMRPLPLLFSFVNLLQDDSKAEVGKWSPSTAFSSGHHGSVGLLGIDRIAGAYGGQAGRF